jgi:hypothetical protein
MAITFIRSASFSLTAAAAPAEHLLGTGLRDRRRRRAKAWAVDGDWRTVQVTVRQHDEAIRAVPSRAEPAAAPRAGDSDWWARGVAVASRRGFEIVFPW